MRAHDVGGQDEDGQDAPVETHLGPSMRTCGGSYTHGAAYGRGASFPMSLLTQGAPAQPCLGRALFYCPLALGRPVHPRNPATVAL